MTLNTHFNGHEERVVPSSTHVTPESHDLPGDSKSEAATNFRPFVAPVSNVSKKRDRVTKDYIKRMHQVLEHEESLYLKHSRGF